MTKSYGSDSAFIKELAKLKKKNPQLHNSVQIGLSKVNKRRMQIQNLEFKMKGVKYYDDTWQLTVGDVRVTFDILDVPDGDKEIYCKKLFVKKSNSTPGRHKRTSKGRSRKK